MLMFQTRTAVAVLVAAAALRPRTSIVVDSPVDSPVVVVAAAALRPQTRPDAVVAAVCGDTAWNVWWVQVWKVGRFMVGRLDWGGEGGEPRRTIPRISLQAKETYRKVCVCVCVCVHATLLTTAVVVAWCSRCVDGIQIQHTLNTTTPFSPRGR